jgi:hypothetical protein
MFAQYLCMYHVLTRIFLQNLIQFSKHLTASELQQAGYTSREGFHVGDLTLCQM